LPAVGQKHVNAANSNPQATRESKPTLHSAEPLDSKQVTLVLTAPAGAAKASLCRVVGLFPGHAMNYGYALIP